MLKKFGKIISLSSFVVLAVACNGGGGGGGSSSSSSVGEVGWLGLDYSSTIPLSCFGHSASTADGATCASISGTFSTVNNPAVNGCDASGVNEASCGNNNGTVIRKCVISGKSLSLLTAYNQSSIDACEDAGGSVVSTCQIAGQADCLAAGGSWGIITPASTVNSCTGYDVDNDTNCSLAGGTYAEVQVMNGGISPAGYNGLPTGTNILRVTENASGQLFFPSTGSQFLKIDSVMEISDPTFTTTHWSGAVSLVNAKQSGIVKYDSELDLIYFNAKFVNSIPANYSDLGISFSGTAYYKD